VMSAPSVHSVRGCGQHAAACSSWTACDISPRTTLYDVMLCSSASNSKFKHPWDACVRSS
jgi:hypothetical protein